MAPRRQDPFEGLRLDERFVRDAKFHEPSAAERLGASGSASGKRCQVVPASRGLPGFFHRFVSPPRPGPPARRLARLLAVLTLTIGLVSLTLLALRHTAGRGSQLAAPPTPTSGAGTLPTSVLSAAQTGATGTSGDGSRSTGEPGEPPPNGDPAGTPAAGFTLTPALISQLSPGHCLNWTAASAAPVVPTLVSCDAPHVDKVTRVVDLAGRFSTWPGGEALRTAANDLCGNPRSAPAASPGDDPGQVVGVLHPDRPSWERGVRQAVCTVRTIRTAALAPAGGAPVEAGATVS